MANLTENQKRSIIDDLIKNGHIGNSLRDMAEAIFLGKKCRDMGLQAIQSDVSQLIDEMLVYYGHNYNEQEKDMLKLIAAKDFYQFYANLTIEEIKLGVRLASRKRFGEVKHFNKFSLDFLSQLLAKYESSDERKKLLHAYNNALKDYEARPYHGLNDTEKLRLSYESLIKTFEKFKNEGPDNLIIPSHHYDYLLNLGCSPPDYALFKENAEAIIRRSNQRKRLIMRVNDTAAEATAGSLLSEAKRLALIALYGELIRNNKTIVDYMTPHLKHLSNAV